MAGGLSVLVEGPPRCGLSTAAAQVAASYPPRAYPVDARSPEGRALVAAGSAGCGARPLVLDNATDGDARALLGEPGGTVGRPDASDRRPRLALFGGPFPSFRSGRGRAALLREGPLNLFEVGAGAERRLWLRGGYPEAFGAASDGEAARWLEAYATDIARGRLGDALPVRDGTLALRILEAIASAQGKPLNENALSRLLGVSRPTIERYLAILVEAGFACTVPAAPRTLAPSVARAARSPGLYVRDPGLLHALLGVGSQLDAPANAARATMSWRGFVVAQALAALPRGTELFRYASADGAALDLVASRGDRPILAATVSRHRPLSASRSATFAARALGLREEGRLFVVYPDGEERPLQGGFVATGLPAFLESLGRP